MNSKRQKRGLINGIGSASNYLFGIATEGEIQQLNDEIHRIAETKERVISQVNKQVTIIHELSSSMNLVRETTKELVNTIEKINENYEQEEILTHILWIQGMLNRLAIQMNTIDMGITKMMEGSLAPEIILIPALQHVVKTLRLKGEEFIFRHIEGILHYKNMQ